VKAANKNVQLETGMTLSAPLFIREGDLIKIDTRSRKYVGRT
ncbi:MAG: elongation factor P, partial [Candidatus Omnitrophica bacterium]|nr:elongation factor P [Candidatus Omnitrophota bacterium]